MVRNGFYKLFLMELQDLYSAENQLVEALPKMMIAATTQELKDAFEKHLNETQNQVSRLENIFSMLNENPTQKKCEAMQGLIRECDQIIHGEFQTIVKDAALIGSAQRVEHYEIAGYGVARTFARQLGYEDIADILDESLDEESAADATLTSIAEGGFFTSGVNQRAQEES